MTTAAPGKRQEFAVIGLVGTAHFTSHFYILVLPPLFPLIKAEFGISYTALGALMTAFGVASGALQLPMGALVDRLGPRYVLIGGLGLLSASVALMGLTDTFGQLLVLAALAGMGNSVFHPADYSILGAAVAPAHLGRAYGVHTFSGFAGWSATPIVLVLLASLWDWRTALTVAGCAGLVITGILFLSRGLLGGSGARHRTAAAPGADAGPRPGRGLTVVLTRPIFLMFLFFVVTAAISAGMSGFLISSLQSLYGTPLKVASAALTGYLAGGAAGVLAGGLVADRLRRLDRVAAIGFTAAAAALCIAAAVAMPAVLTVAVFAFTGMMVGMIGPSRDLLVRAVTPTGATGKVFGFVSSGFDVGGALAPLMFGWFMDLGQPVLVFVGAAVLMMLALGTAVAAGRLGPGERTRAGTAPAE